MPIPRPTVSQLRELARDLFLHIEDSDIDSFLNLLEPNLQGLDSIAHMSEGLPEVHYPRTPGYMPESEENRLGAWYVKTEISGASEGKLTGKTVVLKDNVCLAGVPMMNGTSTLEGYVPEIDATVVTRLLDAGATVVGKAHCEAFCFSGGSHTNAKGPVHNPLKPGYSAGGSSSGSAALVASGEVDLAVGGDQGGSIRMPSAFCGTYGMKPTFGLVPYTGIMPIENTIDHTGPITSTVSNNALMLEVIAGPDGLDPRQRDVRTAAYTDALTTNVSDLRIGVVDQGFGLDSSLPGVDERVRQGARHLERLGAYVENVSVPMHRLGQAIWSAVAMEGATRQMLHGDGYGANWDGLYLPSLMRATATWRDRADELPETLKVSMLLGEWMYRTYAGTYYAKGQNLGLRLRKAYDQVLEDFDMLLMPTVPMVATKLPEPDASREEIVQRAFELVPNTCPFDLTHHPAMSIPCGLENDLPVGMMLIGRHYDESTIYRVAYAYEQSCNWRDNW